MSTINEKVKLLEERLADTRDEITGIDLLNNIAYEIRHTDSALSVKKSLLAAELSQKIDYKKGLASALVNHGFGEMVQANYIMALQILYRATAIFEEAKDDVGKADALYNTGVVYSRIGEYNLALDVFQESMAIRKLMADQKGEATCLFQLAYIYERFGNTEKSYEYYIECLAKQKQVGDQAGIASTLMGVGILKQKRKQYAAAEQDLLESLSIRAMLGETHGWLVSMNYLGEFYLEQNDPEQAKKYLSEAIERAKKQIPPFPANLCRLYTSLVKVYIKYKEYDMGIWNMEQARQIALENNLKYQVYDIYLTLSQLYREKGDYKSALKCYENYHDSKEEIINLAASTKLKNLELFNQVEDEKRKAEIHMLRNIELKKAYDQLQAAQEQLIQSEKMASLGELTAGIAHEIQNPLNFINNFSEINKELLTEMIEETDKGNIEEVRSLAHNIIDNEEKIYRHGRRADSIVKNMLQHSRINAGQKELTHINTLADEYLRLSYHGLRAKDKSFNAIIKTDLDEKIGKINVVSQDIGRVLLNLFNNAFYAVNEKNKRGVPGYEPTVSLITKKEHNKIIIIVSDNGIGISAQVLEKIFQPFFTTKPPGQGTGLGLSLSYDIIKAHGGEIIVETKEAHPDDEAGQDSGAKFTIQLPADK